MDTKNLHQTIEDQQQKIQELEQTIQIQNDIIWKITEELSQKVEEITLISYTDPLTCVANRRKFDEIIQAEMNRTNRYGKIFSLILLDIDYFKKINDTHGHAFWDTVLQQVAQIMKSHIRVTDTVARYGWEEFALILPETDIIWAIHVADKIRKLIEEYPIEKDEDHIYITASLWVSLSNQEMDVDTLFHKADTALYSSKQNGRNQVSFES